MMGLGNQSRGVAWYVMFWMGDPNDHHEETAIELEVKFIVKSRSTHSWK
jgi:hypothetical protein